MGYVEELFQPNLGAYYCNYFYWLLVIYFILAVLQMGELGYAIADNSKNLGKFLKDGMTHRLLALFAISVQFLVIRIFYSMCSRSLSGREGMTQQKTVHEKPPAKVKSGTR